MTTPIPPQASIPQQEPLKLSMLMREGTPIHPQRRHKYYGWNDQLQVCSSCAIGAAMIGYRIRGGEQAPFSVADFDLSELIEAVDISWDTQVLHPVTVVDRDIPSVITELNDIYRWTREQIANWLESIGY